MPKRKSVQWQEEDLTVSKRRNSRTDSSDSITTESESLELPIPSNDLGKLTQLMCTLTNNVNNLAAQKRGSAGNESIPLFYPDDRAQDIIKWVGKIEELKLIHGWDERTTSHYATSRLRGYAATWYNSLPSINYPWNEWKLKLVAAFPTEIDFASTLDSMMKRTKRSNESMIAYYYEKLSLLNMCEIYGAKAASCIIAGILDKNIQRTAKVGNYKSPEELLKYLKTIEERNEGYASTPSYRKTSTDMRPHDMNKNRELREVRDNRKCYGCGSREHILPHCPKKTKKCEKCHRYQQAKRGKTGPITGRKKSKR